MTPDGHAPGRSTRVAEEYGRLILRKAQGDDAAADVEDILSPAQRIPELPAGGGAPLDPAIATRVAQTTGESADDARVHNGTLSAEIAEALGARAFTVGQDIHLGAGESATDPKLMTHEAVHTIQQGDQGAQAQTKLQVSMPGDALEREADAVADAAETGKQAPVSRGGGALVQRDVVSEVRNLLSYGVIDWAITDGEAVKALKKLAALDLADRKAALDKLGGTMRYRLLDQAPGGAKKTPYYAQVVVALGWKYVRPYVKDLLSYGVFDWAITDEEAAEVFRIFMILEKADRRTLWARLGPKFRNRLVDNLKRKEIDSAEEKTVIGVFFHATPDSEADTLQELMRLRFRVVFRASKSKKSAIDWDAAALRRVWPVLEALPPQHVEGNSALDFMESYEGSETTGGNYKHKTKTVNIGYDPENLDEKNSKGEKDVLRDDGTIKDDPLLGVNRFDKVVRHEVGHAVDKKGGHRKVLCIGNEKGGDWASHDTGTMAQTMVTASGGVISKWKDEDQKTKIIEALQKAINAKNSDDVETNIDALSDLSEADKAKVKTDNAVQQLMQCFRDDKPWDKAANGGIPLNGRIYQESYEDDWQSYKASTRSRKVSTYQFRAAGEWFAEAYAAYYTPSATKGELLAAVDPGAKKYFDNFVDPGELMAPGA